MSEANGKPDTVPQIKAQYALANAVRRCVREGVGNEQIAEIVASEAASERRRQAATAKTPNKE